MCEHPLDNTCSSAMIGVINNITKVLQSTKQALRCNFRVSLDEYALFYLDPFSSKAKRLDIHKA
jgi:hypothetical protein